MKLSSPYRSIILNVPQTYPASPLNGILSAGFVAVDLKKATYPESAFNYLSSIGYAIDVDARKAVDQKDMFVKEMFDTFEKRVKAVKHFMAEEPWDIFVAVVTETDRLNHFFFDAAYSSEHPYYKPFIHFYQEIDRFVGEIFENFMKLTDGQGLFMVMSDHGFTELKEEVYINNWLIREGFLKIKQDNEFFEKIDTGTKAFAMDPARIYINTEKRFPRGSVKESEKRSVMEELISALTLLKGSDGNRVIKAIHKKEQLYHGPSFDKAPDLVCIPNDGYDLKATFQKKNVFGKGHFTGMHTRHDAHCILPVHIQHSEKLHIEDLAVYILDYFAADQ
jgi:predicted AlkP superfamily phosphohydrolase/phosphomutase